MQEEISMKATIINKINNKEICVGVVGLGYVGLPLAVEKAKSGFRTIGFDIQSEKVSMVNSGHNYIGDVVNEDLADLVSSGKLSATSDYSFISEVDFVAICVPTPLDAYQQPNIKYVKDSAIEIAKYMKKGAMIVLESTTYPGTTEELLKPILETGSGLRCSKDFYLGFSPERVDPGNAYFKTKNTPKVVGAIGEDAKELISMMYRSVLEGDVHTVSTPAVAEMEKILENTYRNVNIGLINELAMLCNRMGINIWEVIEAAKTKPYGFQAFYPGPGLGGHCIPLDPYYLSWKAREYGFHTSMIEASMTVNDQMPEYCVRRIAEILNKDKKSINGSSVLVSGIAYKKDIDDYRESPALVIIDLLKQSGATVDFYDPLIQKYKYHGKEYSGGLTSLKKEALQTYDIVVITTDHSQVDYDLVDAAAKRIFDTKNAMHRFTDRSRIELL